MGRSLPKAAPPHEPGPQPTHGGSPVELKVAGSSPVQCGAVPLPAPPQTSGQFNLAKAFDTLVVLLAHRECIVWRDRRLGAAPDVAERSRRLGAYLHGRGLTVHRERSELQGWGSGQDHVTLALYENGNEYLEGMLSLVHGRVAAFNVNYRYVGEELRYLLNDGRPSARSSCTRRSHRPSPTCCPPSTRHPR